MTIDIEEDFIEDTRSEGEPEPMEAEPSAVEAEPDSAEAESKTVEADDRRRYRGRGGRVRRLLVRAAFCSLLALPFVLAVSAGYLKYLDLTAAAADSARTDSTRAATEAAVAMLTYRPDTVQNDLEAAERRMTGPFRDSFASLVNDVVAPASIQKLITAAATVTAAAPISATPDHATVLIFVNQTVTVGNEAPSNSESTVRVTLDRVDRDWLVSGFDPI